MKTIILGSIAALTATSALAGSADTAPADPVVVTPAPIAAAPVSGDWTGPYVGLSFGGIEADNNATSEQGGLIGAHAGYDYDFGNFVLGGELEYQAMDLTVGTVDIDSITRLKARAGIDMGPALLYGVAGAAQLDSSIGTGTGAVYGLGAEYKITEQFSFGAEYLGHTFDDVGSTTTDVDAQTVNFRGTFRF